MADIESSPGSSREDTGSAKKPAGEVEARQSRPAPDDERDKPARPYGEVYLIERQAIEWRRARVKEAADVARRRSGRPASGDFELPPEPAPSSNEDLARYRRPEDDATKTPASSGLASRAAAWLRRAFRPNT
jgi:hypothetical protein